MTTTEMPGTLTPFGGHEVTQSKIEIRNVGGGLQEALRLSPEEIDPGERRRVVLDVECDSVRFDPIKDSDCMARVHIFKLVGDRISFVDDDVDLHQAVGKHMDTQAERLEEKRRRAAGVMTMEEGMAGVRSQADGDEEPFGHEPGENAEEE